MMAIPITDNVGATSSPQQAKVPERNAASHQQPAWPHRVSFLLLLVLVLPACTSTANLMEELAVGYDMPAEILTPIAHAGIDDQRQNFANLFCAVLEEMDEFDEWGPCEKYWRTTATDVPPLGEISKDYRVLVISGIFAQCVSSRLTAFSNGLTRLREIHGLDAEDLEVTAFGSSAQNGRTIAQHLKDSNTPQDRRPFIVVAFSKGAPDLFEGIVNDPEAREMVAAVITVAGAMGGSPAVDLLQDGIIPSLVAYFGGDSECDFGDQGGFDSLFRQNRHRFIADNDWPIVPSYSIVGAVDFTNTSLINRPTWQLLALYAKENDGQLLAYESIVPRGTFLGAANADHWALAMPFDTLQDDELERTFISHNEFPREAMLEAAVRFVIADLEGNQPVAR